MDACGGEAWDADTDTYDDGFDANDDYTAVNIAHAHASAVGETE